MLNLAPRCTATSPATTPAAPTAVASHKAVTTAPGDMWMGRTTQGGPTAGMTTGGYAESLRTSDAKIMIRIELLMHVKASHQSTRATRVTSTSGARITSSRCGPRGWVSRSAHPARSCAWPSITTSQRVRLVDQVGIDLARISSGHGKAALGADEDLRWVI